jgi:hypothetical protein
VGAERLRSERQVPRDRREGYARVVAISTCAGPMGESMVSVPQDHPVNLIAPSPDPRHETGVAMDHHGAGPAS